MTTADGGEQRPSTTTPSPDDDDPSPVAVSLAHVAAGVNAVPGSLHWGPRDLIAYGAGPAVFLYDQGSGRVRASMVVLSEETSVGNSDGSAGPSGRVCCVRWKGPEAISEKNGKSCCCWAELASGTSDGFVATWRVRLPADDDKSDGDKSGRPPSSSSSFSSCCDLLWEQTALLRIESGAGVTSLAWHEEEEGEQAEEDEEDKGKKKSTLVALAGTEAAVFVREESFSSSSSSAASAWVPCQRLSILPRLAHAAALSVLGGKDEEKKLLLAVGAVDGATLLFLGGAAASPSSSSSAAAAVFSPVPAAAAKGHGDWVRGVAFTSKSNSSSRKKGQQQQAKEEEMETTAAAAENGASRSSSFSSSSSSSSSSLLMATASNDRTVRVWEVSLPSSSGGGGGRGEEEKGGENSLDDDDDVTALAASSSSSSKPSSSSSVSVRLVATLTGHDDWVMSVDWKKKKRRRNGKGSDEPPCLLSVSADRSARLWSPAAAAESFFAADGTEGGGDGEEGLGLCAAVVGDAGSAAALGFCGGCFSPDGDGLAAAGPAGAVHVWRREKEKEEEEEEEEEEEKDNDDLSLSPLSLSSPPSPSRPRPLRRRRWEARPSAGGHCARVVDCCWAGPDGASLLSVSEDQTARICTWLAPTAAAAEGKGEGEEGESGEREETWGQDPRPRAPPPLWAEVARPQTHGHDFSCVAAVLSPKRSNNEPSVYASGSEEKVIRVFEAPRAFSQTLAWARGERAGGGASDPASSSSSSAAAAAFGATLPALGLSNRAVHRESGTGRGVGRGGEAGEAGNGAAGENEAEEEEEEEGAAAAEIYPEGPDALPAAAPAPLRSRPVEAALAGGTLWPEVVKLYGHGAELSALAATAGGAVVGRRGKGGAGGGGGGGAGGGGGGGAAASSSSGPLFASAAAAKAARWASIRLWRRREAGDGAAGGAGLSPWVAAASSKKGAAAAAAPPGECHSLTVTRLAFREVEGNDEEDFSSSSSPPPLLLLASASRDRSFAVHAVVCDGEGGEGGCDSLCLETLVHKRGAHSRALTDCAWAPPGSSSSASTAFLATSSRDGSVKVWSLALPLQLPGKNPEGGEPGSAAAEMLQELPRARVPATALAFAPRCRNDGGGEKRRKISATLAVGLGDGGVQLWTVGLGKEEDERGASPPPLLLWSAPAAQRHAAAVRRLSFAPEWARLFRGGGGGKEQEGEEEIASSSSWLASVGDDGAVRVFRCRC